MVVFGVLGPVTAWDDAGRPIVLKGPRHRAVLARLIIARRRVVPVSDLVDDLWEDPPPGAVGAVRTFVAALRRALEPGRPPRATPRLLVTEGPGYALRPGPAGSVDSWRFEQAVRASAGMPPGEASALLEEALGWWRGPAYADFAAQEWAVPERARLAELRLHAVERHAEARLALGRAAETVADLDAHVAGHPWREDGWRLLALALYRTGRQGDALAVLRRARTLLVERLGLDPGPALRRLESDILRQSPDLDVPAAEIAPLSPTLDPSQAKTRGPAATPATEQGRPDTEPATAAGARQDTERRERHSEAARVWERAAAAYDRAAPSASRARLESAVALMRDLAVTGGTGLLESRRHRVAAAEAAEELGDPEFTARVIGLYDVPANWTRSDDPDQAARLVAAAERTLAALPRDTPPAARARLLATIALESRGTPRPGTAPFEVNPGEAAREAERLARGLDEPALLAFALNGTFMQSFHRAGLAAERDAVGEELITLSARHGLVTYEVLGHLIRLQSRGALADFPAADQHARAAEDLAGRHELPLVSVFTAWYRALRLDVTGQEPGATSGSDEGGLPGHQGAGQDRAEAAYRQAAVLLDGAGMPGLEHGLLPLALLCARLRRGGGRVLPLRTGADAGVASGLLPPAGTGEARGLLPPAGADAAWGPYLPWVRPVLLLGEGRPEEAAAALQDAPDPPRDLLQEALWCLMARAAVALGDHATMRRARQALAPAAGELAGAGSGLLTLGPVDWHLTALENASPGRTPPHL